ncbi:YitT family protein [Caviibacter abscessus]|uniref:YitT family protein n=1 Tax=Caviibacter abscessus TaxID=1766719 RepID=UPI000833D1E6|nr:YitT family protein [Caviibacter abscessus]
MKAKRRFLLSVFLILISSFTQAYIIQSIMTPAHILASGFTGLSMLFNLILSKFNINISVSFFIIMFNLPVAIMCAKGISKKFTFLSLLQIITTSILLKIFHFEPVFNNVFLSVTVGAFAYGLALVLALRTGGSTGGTDFIALYISNKINKTIWDYILVFNAVILIIFGYLSGWDRAGYSILFQYILTKTISTFYHRYHRVTLQIITKKPDEIIEGYISQYRHGITKTCGEGGYTKQPIFILYTVISSYELNDTVRLVKEIDEKVIINVFKTEDFYGSFYMLPI